MTAPDGKAPLDLEAKTHWDRPSHFCGSAECKFGITDVVNGHIISTVGDYRPGFAGYGALANGMHPIGCDRFYETMVFKDSGERCKKEGDVCSCGNLPKPVAFVECDFDGYQTEAEARAGHAAMVAKYAALDGAK